ncbi:hypothetical protein EW145_g1384 [Phellinidium pouzarii]|uniref:Peptidase S53 domain-containing protein n=1 Tax=Phellinidium pouzarii TaxID=167371 RepID=A0A4S4LFD1_9AGAM|nr:hypothetical protein EW145_g1384 [Phellinidium pouzarii]
MTPLHIWVLLSLPIVFANPLLRRWDDFEVKHAWVDVPSGWVIHSDPSPDHTLDLRIGLKQDKFEELVDHLYQVSDPSHERYGAHLSKEEVEALVAPHPDSIADVDAWFEHHGIEPASVQRSPAGDWLSVSVSVAQAERMLGTKYHVFYNPESETYLVRTTAYALPRTLHTHVSLVAPTTYFGGMRYMRTMNFLQPDVKAIDGTEAAAQLKAVETKVKGLVTVPASCEYTITPACLKALYNTTGYTPQATDVNMMGVSGYLGQFANDADLQTFFRLLLPNAVGTTFTHVEVNGGGNDQTQPGIEANLDIQYTEGMTFPTPNIYFSVMFSSGDFGVGGGDCLTNDGTNTVRFQPIFPASCPYVTSVGATTNINPEVVASFSSGGFSNYFAQPSYQTRAVSTFLTGLDAEFVGLFNASGRGFPDVSAQGQNFQVVLGGETVSVGGTSASSPTFAGVVSLLNDFRIASGQSTLGFLNPFLYSSGVSGLNDITSGSNPGCGEKGFTAVTGWDPITGLGTPDFGKLQTIIADAGTAKARSV